MRVLVSIAKPAIRLSVPIAKLLRVSVSIAKHAIRRRVQGVGL